jgi:hypothetical protein
VVGTKGREKKGEETYVADSVSERINPVVEITNCIIRTRSCYGTVANFGAASYDVVGAGEDEWTIGTVSTDSGCWTSIVVVIVCVCWCTTALDVSIAAIVGAVGGLGSWCCEGGCEEEGCGCGEGEGELHGGWLRVERWFV